MRLRVLPERKKFDRKVELIIRMLYANLSLGLYPYLRYCNVMVGSEVVFI